MRPGSECKRQHEKAVMTPVIDVQYSKSEDYTEWLIVFTHPAKRVWMCVCATQARKALADRQKDLEVKTQQLEIKLSNKTEEDIKKARRKSTQAGQISQSFKYKTVTAAMFVSPCH